MKSSKSPQTNVSQKLRSTSGRIAWLLLALACCFLAYIARMHEVTHDAFHEMSLYREALIRGELPKEDVFAYTPTVSPSVHHEWATGAILYWSTVGSQLGLPGLALLKFGCIGLMWFVLYRTARLRGCHPAIFAIFSLIVFPMMWVGFATVRAQLFTLLFLSVQLYFQELDWRGRRLWILAWLLMLIAWLNLHAGFVVGCGLIAFHTLERIAASWLRTRRLDKVICDSWHLLVASPVAVAALGCNPYGWQYIDYLIRAIGMERPLIKEWQPLWMTYSPGITMLAFALSVGLVFCLAWLLLKQLSNRGVNHLSKLRGLSFVLLSAVMALKHIRHGSIYAVAWIAIIPAWVSRTEFSKRLLQTLDEHDTATRRVCQAIIGVCLLFATWHQCWRPTMPPERLYSTACYPTGAVKYLQSQEFTGNLLTPFHVGSYVSWEMYPQVRVSLDGRYEVAYQPQVLPEHNQFFAAEDKWWQYLEKTNSDAVLVHAQAPVVNEFDSLAEDDHPTRESWRVVYRDAAFVVLASDHCGLKSTPPRPLEDGAWNAFSAKRHHHDLHDQQLRQALSRTTHSTSNKASFAKVEATTRPLGHTAGVNKTTLSP